MSRDAPRPATRDQLAAEAERYLAAVAAFAALGADPHAAARFRAAQARQREDSPRAGWRRLRR